MNTRTHPIMADSLPILPGTVAFLALAALARGGRMHGFELVRWIDGQSDGDILLEEGALYPALHRLEKRGLLEAEWAVSEKGRRAKYYTLTTRGREVLGNESAEWDRYVAAVGKVVTGDAPA